MLLVALVLLMTLNSPQLAQPAFAQQTAQRSEKIEVTGTNIKRVDAEGPARPIVILAGNRCERSAHDLGESDILFAPSAFLGK